MEKKLGKLKKEFERKKRKGMSLEEFLRLSKEIIKLEKEVEENGKQRFNSSSA